jgi:hypothetical protein
MKINFNRSLKKNRPTYIHSVFYPAAGYVAMPENRVSDLERKKDTKKIKHPRQEPGSIVDMIKQFLYNIISICKNRERA